MAVIRDVMPAFELFQPTSVDDALSLLDRYQGDAWVMAGGMDTFDWLKDRIKRPSAVVDLSGIAELKGIKPRGDGPHLGCRFATGIHLAQCGVRDPFCIDLKEIAQTGARITSTETISTQRNVTRGYVSPNALWHGTDII